MPLILTIDQGTTSTRAVIFDQFARVLASASKELTQYFPAPGYVEHDAEQIWSGVAEVVARALAVAGVNASDLAGIGVTNQRETVLLWDRATSKPLCKAIVWQDRRTADFCRQRASEEPWIFERSGLVLDPYFSATKIRWLLEQRPELRRASEAGDILCGTIDTWLLWNLTAGKVHATDASNASRTLLLNLETAAWDDDLCRFCEVPQAMLPSILPSAAAFGVTRGLRFLPDGIPIAAIARAEAYPDVRRRSVVAFAERSQYDEGHARHVAALALSLFDQTQARHELGARP